MALRRASPNAPLLGIALWFVAQAAADFVPGRVYVTKSNAECGFGGVFGRIYEFDPVTANWKLFAELPSCNLYGLAFTPDGKGLRVAAGFAKTVYEVAGDGSWKVALGPEHGLTFPAGTNNLSYDADGNFFVNNGPPVPNIMKYPGGQPPGTVFAGLSNGTFGAGGLANALDGSLYYRPQFYPEPNQFGAILRYSPAGVMTVFDNVGKMLGGLAVDAADNLYALSTQGLYRYEGGDPSKRSLVYSGFMDPENAIAMSIDGETVYTILGGIDAINVQSGTITTLAQLPPELLPSGWGAGIAVYVPELSSLPFLLLSFLVVTLLSRNGR